MQAECDAHLQRVRLLEAQAGGSDELQRQLEEQKSLARDLTEVQPCVRRSEACIGSWSLRVHRSYCLKSEALQSHSNGGYRSVTCTCICIHAACTRSDTTLATRFATIT